MSQENVTLVRRVIDVFNESGAPATERFYSEDIVADMSRSPFPDAGVYRGIGGVRKWFDGLAEAFGHIRYEIERIQGNDDQVAVLLRVHGRGPGSGIPVDYRFAPVFTVRDGKVVRVERLDERAEALEAAGLSE